LQPKIRDPRELADKNPHAALGNFLFARSFLLIAANAFASAFRPSSLDRVYRPKPGNFVSENARFEFAHSSRNGVHSS
jgi:hypothetical protein